MRNLVVPFLFSLFVLLSCTSEKNFLLVGSLPDKSYDGETIYLVPMENAVKERVDSTIIREGAFRFQGRVTAPEIYIIRAKPVLRYNLEELLVVREPGGLTVKIDMKSSVGGTPLNDSLQVWKERKMRFDFVKAELVKQYREADGASKPEIKQRADMLDVDAMRFHFNFAKNNKNNLVGRLVLRIMASSFTPEQKKELEVK
jgi:hypothetical protein